MAMNFRFVVFCLWLCLAVCRATHASSEGEEGPAHLLFAPEKLLSGDRGAQGVPSLWRKYSHLRPNYYRGRALIPTHFWLLLLAGDVEVNPGPIRYPCTVCSKSVKSNQRGILCDRCELWTHARCCQTDATEYERLGTNDGEDWLCPLCFAAELPFADVSLPGSHSADGCALIEDSLEANGRIFDGCDGALIIGHLNVRSLIPKRDEMHDILVTCKEDNSRVVLGLSETWLDSSISDSEVAIPGYKLFRSDRNRRGGGVMVYVPEGVKAVRRPDLEDGSIEAVWLELETSLGHLLFCSVYRPPNARTAWMEDLSHMLERAFQEAKEVVIGGDFNCNILNPDSTCNKLAETMSEFNVTQMVSCPTRVTQSSVSLIDLLYASNPSCFSRVCCKEVGLSDHNIVYGVVAGVVRNQQPSPISIRCYSKCDPETLVSDLNSAPWHVMDSFDEANDRWNFWKSLFLKIVNANIPLRKVRVKSNALPWIDRDIRVLMRVRNYLHTKAKASKRSEDWERYRNVRNQVTSKMRRAKLQHFEVLSEQSKSNPRKLWKELNKVLGRKNKQRIDTLNSQRGALTALQDIVDEFNGFFSKYVSVSEDTEGSECEILPDQLADGAGEFIFQYQEQEFCSTLARFLQEMVQEPYIVLAR